MIMILDEEPRANKEPLLNKKLDTLSVHELEAYINDLEAEILRVRDEIKRKNAHKSAAEALFGNK